MGTTARISCKVLMRTRSAGGWRGIPGLLTGTWWSDFLSRGRSGWTDAQGLGRPLRSRTHAGNRTVAADNPTTSVVIPERLADVETVEVVVAHSERATLRVGGVFLKIDADQTNTDVELEAMAMAPIPTPKVLWRKPPVLALATVPGRALGRLGEPST